MHIPFDFIYPIFYDNFFNTLDNMLYIEERTQSYDLNQSKLGTTLPPQYSTTILYDQEPIDLTIFYDKILRSCNNLNNASDRRLLITSEHSKESDFLCGRFGLTHVHYFYHALLCHEWYRHYWYRAIKANEKFEHVYIIYNNLVIDKRLYRANLVAELHSHNLLEHGLVSFNSPGTEAIARSADTYSLLPSAHKSNILGNLDLLSQKRVIDTDQIHGGLSAEIDITSMQKAFVNVVAETVYYENKLHLTEKVFKPIVAKVPFLLLAGAGNLEYLRRYGFKTFSDWWDEGYDTITDNVERNDAVMKVLRGLCALPHHELVDMKRDMVDTLEFNSTHFFKSMRPIVVDEFTRNLSAALQRVGIAYNHSDLQNLNTVLAY